MIAGQVRADAACLLLIRRQRLRLGGLGCTRGTRSVVLCTHNTPTTAQKESPLGTATQPQRRNPTAVPVMSHFVLTSAEM